MRERGSTEHGGSSDTSADATSFADGERETLIAMITARDRYNVGSSNSP